MATKKISELDPAAPLTGPEIVEIVQDGVSVRTTTQDIADLGGGGGGGPGTVPIYIALSDETSPLVAGAGKFTFRMPFAANLVGIRASVNTAPTGAAIQVDVNEGGASVLSTKLTIDQGEKTSVTAATAAVISDSALADDAEISIDLDQVGSVVAGAGLKVLLVVEAV